jgi:hypothetical protein
MTAASRFDRIIGVEKMIRRTILIATLFAAASAPLASAQDQNADLKEALKKACRDDYQHLCNGVMPGGGRILACLRSHSSELSPACAAALPK